MKITQKNFSRVNSWDIYCKTTKLYGIQMENEPGMKMYFLLKMGISHWYVIPEGEISSPRGAKPLAFLPGGRSIVALAAVHGQHVRNARLLGCEKGEDGNPKNEQLEPEKGSQWKRKNP